VACGWSHVLTAYCRLGLSVSYAFLAGWSYHHTLSRICGIRRFDCCRQLVYLGDALPLASPHVHFAFLHPFGLASIVLLQVAFYGDYFSLIMMMWPNQRMTDQTPNIKAVSPLRKMWRCVVFIIAVTVVATFVAG